MMTIYCCELQQSTEEEVSVYETRSKNAPTYNPVLNHSQPLTKISIPPFIAAPSHEFSTLLTMFRQVEKNQDIGSGYGPKNCNYLGHGVWLFARKPAKQLENAQECCQGKWILRL